MDFVFPEFRFTPIQHKTPNKTPSKKPNTTNKKTTIFNCDNLTATIAVVITEIFTCLDLQEIVNRLAKEYNIKIDFSFNNFYEYLEQKVNIYRTAFDVGLKGFDIFEKGFTADKSGFVATLLSMIPNLSSDASFALTVFPYITSIENDYSGRYISTNGSLIMALFDVTIGGIIDIGAKVLELRGMPEVGIFFSTIAEELYNIDAKRNKAEFIAYNWFYLLFVDWSAI